MGIWEDVSWVLLPKNDLSNWLLGRWHLGHPFLKHFCKIIPFFHWFSKRSIWFYLGQLRASYFKINDAMKMDTKPCNWKKKRWRFTWSERQAKWSTVAPAANKTRSTSKWESSLLQNPCAKWNGKRNFHCIVIYKFSFFIRYGHLWVSLTICQLH